MDFLEELRTVGTVESVGNFTLDSERALELLARFRFASPYEYVLKLVQAGVAGGAQQVDVRVSRRETSVEFLGWSPAPDFWEDPLRQALERGNHLGVGLLAARGLHPRDLETTREPLRIVIREPERPSRVYAGPTWGRWTDAVQHLPADLIAELSCRWDGEFTQVWRRCVFAPIPVTLNGRRVNKPFFAGRRIDDRTESSMLPSESGWAYDTLVYLVADAPSPSLVPAPRAIPRLRMTNELDGAWDQMHFFGTPPACSWVRMAEFPGEIGERLPPTEHVRRLPFGLAAPVPCPVKLYGIPEDAGLPVLPLWKIPGVACHAALGRIGQEDGWLALVRDGVVLRKTDPPRRELADWRVLADASSLALTLSQLDVVEDERYDLLLDCLVRATEVSRRQATHPHT